MNTTFYIAAFIALIATLLTITRTNGVHALLYLIVSLLAVAAVFYTLGAGFHTEYSGMKFGMFFIGEYVGILVISAMITILFFGGWQGPLLPPLLWFLLKTAVLVAFFILLRAALPRPRYDQLMALGWLLMLPLALLNIAVTGAIMLIHSGG